MLGMTPQAGLTMMELVMVVCLGEACEYASSMRQADGSLASLASCYLSSSLSGDYIHCASRAGPRVLPLYLVRTE